MFTTLIQRCCILATLLTSVTSLAATDTKRSITQGQLTGTVAANGALVWRGIPFAAPPVGELRWQAPREPKAWSGTLAATKNSEACVQTVHLAAPHVDTDGDGYVGSEDCLYLNVFSPANATAKSKLPVMYWIFGGGNVGGSNAAPSYDGSFLAQKHNVVVVTINYRVGPLGWFIHPALYDKTASAEDKSGNWGTLDTIRGLEWVRDNIGAFGGDAKNVTAFGESAGGVNVMALVISPRAKGLFHRAIVESGGVQGSTMSAAQNFSDDAEPGQVHSSREIVNKILIRDGVAKDRTEAKAKQIAMSDTEIRTLLLAQTPQQFMKVFNPNNVRLFSMVRMPMDGAVLPKEPGMETIAAGHFNKVPMILGTNRDERRIYQASDPRWLKVLATDPDAYKLFANYGSVAWKLRGVDAIAEAMHKAGHDAIYAYRFDWDEQGVVNGRDMSLIVGAGHSIEIPFVFGVDVNLQGPIATTDDAARRALSASMMSYWAQFAHTANPGKGRNGNEVAWTPYQINKGANKRIVFDTQHGGGIRMSTDAITHEQLKQAVLTESGFTDQAMHCEIYVSLFRENGWSDAEYQSLGREGCAKFPVSTASE
jgi:para-nitrobenzyl esterase